MDSPGSIVRSSISGCRPLDIAEKHALRQEPGSNPGQGATQWQFGVYYGGLASPAISDKSTFFYLISGQFLEEWKASVAGLMAAGILLIIFYRLGYLKEDKKL